MAIIFSPTFDGTTAYSSCYPTTMSQSGGEIVGKGFTIQPGWSNEGLWEATFQFKHDNIRYTGICFVADVSYNGSGAPSNTLTTWEGSWPGGSAYATYSAGAVGYFDVTVTKLDDTHVRLRSTTLNRDTTVEIPWLANSSMVTCGARHNPSGSSYGPCRIKNLVVRNISMFDNASNVTIGGKTVESIIKKDDGGIIYEVPKITVSLNKDGCYDIGANNRIIRTVKCTKNGIDMPYQTIQWSATNNNYETDKNGIWTKETAGYTAFDNTETFTWVNENISTSIPIRIRFYDAPSSNQSATYTRQECSMVYVVDAYRISPHSSKTNATVYKKGTADGGSFSKDANTTRFSAQVKASSGTFGIGVCLDDTYWVSLFAKTGTTTAGWYYGTSTPAPPTSWGSSATSASNTNFSANTYYTFEVYKENSTRLRGIITNASGTRLASISRSISNYAHVTGICFVSLGNAVTIKNITLC